jgi:hypothetical protein
MLSELTQNNIARLADTPIPLSNATFLPPLVNLSGLEESLDVQSLNFDTKEVAIQISNDNNWDG